MKEVVFVVLAIAVGKISTAYAFAAQAPIVPTSRTAMMAAVTGRRKSLSHNPRRVRRA